MLPKTYPKNQWLNKTKAKCWFMHGLKQRGDTKARNELHHASQHLGAISDSAFSRQRILVGTATTLLTTWGMTILVMFEFHGKEASDVHQSVRVNKHLCCREQHIPVLQLRSGQ
ncbi:unnamed protein product [Brassica oleracea var. botrytis]